VNTKKEFKFMVALFICLVIVGVGSPILFYQYEKKNAPIRKEKALELLEKKASETNEYIAEKGLEDTINKEIKGVPLNNENIYMADGIKRDPSDKSPYFNPKKNKKGLTIVEVSDYKGQLLTYFYADNYNDGQVLLNRIMGNYDLSLLDDEHLKWLIIDLNLYYDQSSKNDKVDTFQFHSPEVLAHLFLRSSFEDQVNLIYEKESIIVSNNSDPKIIDVSEVSPSAHGAHKYFLGVSRGKCFQIQVNTIYGDVYLYIYRDHIDKLSVLSLENMNSTISSTYEDVLALYEPEEYSDAFEDVKDNFKTITDIEDADVSDVDISDINILDEHSENEEGGEGLLPNEDD